jgi:N6-L-threonylcarbamoyladenine synthase
MGVELCIAPPELCTDNAVMGAIAFERLRASKIDTLDLDAQPGLVRHSPLHTNRSSRPSV